MNVILFGANGIIGQSVLRECLLDPDVTFVKTIGNTSANVRDRKLIQFQNLDMWNYKRIESELKPFDVCIYCVGVSSLGITEEKYTHITYTMTVVVAAALVRLNPNMTFIYVSGAGADSSEAGRSMWARIKGKTENALLAMPFKAAFMFRPAGVQRFYNMESKTPLHFLLNVISKPVVPLLRWLFPTALVSSEVLSQSILRVAKNGAPKSILENSDIVQL
jgi:uncharacterized protein YbjT (DUF2867 family)